MRFIRFTLLIQFILILNLTAQPKLVVGVVIDQMRYEYLYRFSDNYGKDGFKRIMNEGSNFTFAHYNYVPTYTAAGHASIYTGTTPFYHGITGNEIFNENLKKKEGSVEDDRYKVLSGSGGFSPLNLFSTTIGDQLKLSNNMQSKVISISIKDRASILPGGRYANAAYFYDHQNGVFTTSEYYMKAIPSWLEKFNLKKLPFKYIQQQWNLSLPIEKYKNSLPDSTAYEPDIFSEGRNSFPHSLKNINENDKPAMLIATPYGNQLLIDLAAEVLDNEKLGQHEFTDMLCVSFSSPDYVGHDFGPNSVEIHDLYIKLDAQLSALLKMLDTKVGKGNYTLFLTGDHGVNQMQNDNKKSDSEYLDYENFKTKVKNFVNEKYGSPDVIKYFMNKQVFLDYEMLVKKGFDVIKARREIAEYIRENFIVFSTVITRDDLYGQVPRRDNNNFILNGFNNIRSGDIFLEVPPTYYWGKNNREAGHGTPYAYDTHIPILFYGWGVPKKVSNEPVFIVDIAPTITNLLNINEPSGCIGIPLLNK